MTRALRISCLMVAALVLVGGVAAGVKRRPRQNAVLALLAPDSVQLTNEQLNKADTSAGLAEFIAVLEKQGQPVPSYLRLVSDEYSNRPRESATFAVGCYWEGERELGKLPGVVSSRTGMMGADEVVQVRFDPDMIPYGKLAGTIRQMSCYRGERPRDAKLALDPDQQHDLGQHPEYDYLPLTAGQATKVNAALGANQDADAFLSPAQVALRKRLAAGVAHVRGNADWLSDLRPDRSREGLAGYDDALEDLLAEWD